MNFIIKRILYPLITIFFILMIYTWLFEKIQLLNLRNSQYDKIYESNIQGRITDIGIGRYTSIQLDGDIWYDAGFRKIISEPGDSMPDKTFELNDSISKKAFNDTVLLIRKGKKYLYIL